MINLYANYQQLIRQFQIKGNIEKIVPFGNGHIHDSFRLFSYSSEGEDYLLQRINHHVFKEVEQMMYNIWRVTTYLKEKNNHPTSLETLNLILTQNGHFFYRDEAGNYWRMYLFMKNLHAYDVPQTTEQIYEGAKAFGNFLQQLSSFPTTELLPVLPNFHNIIARLDDLKLAIEQNQKKRVRSTKKLLKYIWSIADEMCQIQRLGKHGNIPLRVTHNDTKFNNVLLDKSGKAKMVVDLDTIMPGFVHYDFGDGIRTTITTATEDEADLNKIQVDLTRFRAFAKGYLEACQKTLSPLEIKYLPTSPALLAYMMAVRFLTDFLNGDIYYKTHFEAHNLQRAKAQLSLCQKLLACKEEFERILSLI